MRYIALPLAALACAPALHAADAAPDFETYRAAYAEIVQATQAAADLAAKVHDRATADAAAPAMQQLADRLSAAYARAKALPAPAPGLEKRLRESLEPAATKANTEFAALVVPLVMGGCHGSAALDTAISSISK